MDFVKKYKKDISYWIFCGIIFFILYSVFDELRRVLMPFIYGVVLAYILDPLIRWAEKKKIKRVLAILLVFGILLLFLSLFFGTFIPIFISETGSFISELPNITSFIIETIEKIKSGEVFPFINSMSNYFDIQEEVGEFNRNIGVFLRSTAEKIIKSTGMIINIIMTPVITFYILKDKEMILRKMKKMIPKKYKGKLESIYKDTDVAFGGFVRGQLLIAITIGTLTGVGCKIIGVPYSLTIGVFAGITNIIPYFGPWIGGILPTVLALMDSPISALWVVILIIIIQQGESIFLTPQIMSQSVGIHPLLVMFSVLFFGRLFGIVGMIFGVPIMSTLIVLTRHIDFSKEKSKEILE